jgi:hypothetical protein
VAKKSLEELENEVPSMKPPSQMLVECDNCEKPVIATARGYSIDFGDWENGIPGRRWTLLECDKSHPILVLQVDPTDDPRVWHWDDPIRIYPPRDRELSSLIPEQLRQVHEEARACFHAKAYTAAAVMSGRTLEGACAAHGIKERNLQQSLSKMKEAGYIDGRLWEWAQTLRNVRNSAAHFDSNIITKQDAEDSVAFSEALLDYLYVLTARFEALKDRRAKRTSETESLQSPKTGQTTKEPSDSEDLPAAPS